MRMRLTEADFDSIGLVKRAVELVGLPVKEEDVALALKWIDDKARKGSVLKPAPKLLVGHGAFAVAALRSGYRVVREAKGSHTVKVNMVVIKERDSNWDRLIDTAILNDGVFTVVQAHSCGVTGNQLHQHVLDGTFERVTRGVLRIAANGVSTVKTERREPVTETHVRVTKAVHARLLALQKQLSVSMTAVVEAAVNALEKELVARSDTPNGAKVRSERSVQL